MTHPNREDVRRFLQEVKDVLTSPPGSLVSWVVVKREKNLRFIAQLGFNYDDVKDTVLGLSIEDYCEGPVDDRDQQGYVWIFGKTISGKEAYIKLKLATLDKLRSVRVVSFHEAEQVLKHPFK
ncbi:MAG: type II toxin-antitoxin system MqsR family toxin [Chloroflexota bacterium]